MDFSRRFSDRAEAMQPLAIRKVMMRIRKPGFISFAGGQPAPGMFPVQAIAEKVATLLQDHGPNILQYAGTEGYRPLREWIAGQTNYASADDVLIISGSQQAIDLAGKLFIDPGDKVVVTNPTYTGAISSFKIYQAQFLEVESDDEGMIPASLAAALQQSPKLIYCIPNFMNPTGVDMTLARRQAVVDLAQQYGVPILEDDPYGALRYDGDAKPTLQALAADSVIYASTFSKTMAPGFRLAWIIAPQSVYAKLLYAKQAGDLQSSGFTQVLAYEVARDGFLEAHIGQIREYYCSQRDAMVAAVARYFPQEVSTIYPKGGLFLWAELPAHLDATALLEEALAAKVAYVPGTGFYANGGGKNSVRLSFSIATREQIDTGIKALGEIFTRAVQSG